MGALGGAERPPQSMYRVFMLFEGAPPGRGGAKRGAMGGAALPHLEFTSDKVGLLLVVSVEGSIFLNGLAVIILLHRRIDIDWVKTIIFPDTTHAGGHSLHLVLNVVGHFPAVEVGFVIVGPLCNECVDFLLNVGEMLD